MGHLAPVAAGAEPCDVRGAGLDFEAHAERALQRSGPSQPQRPPAVEVMLLLRTRGQVLKMAVDAL